MAFSPQKGDAQVPLSVFGSYVTEMSPIDVPAGVSPANQDVIYLPGSVASRNGLARVFTIAFPSGGPHNFVPTLTYGKSFVTPAGVIYNLWLDSNCNLWVENWSTTPGNFISLAEITYAPGTYAKSVTAFGREYLAFSDGRHGTEVALQWDGTNLDRVTQDGPGAGPMAASVALPTVGMATTGTLTLSVVESDPEDQINSGQFTSINMYTPTSVANLNVADQVTLSGYSGSSAPMNGTWSVIAIYAGIPNNLVVLSAVLPSTTVFSVASATASVTTGSLVRQNNIVTAKTSAPHSLQVGYQALVAGFTAAVVGTDISTIVIDNEDLPGLATVTTSSPHGLVPNTFVSLTGILATVVGGTIATAFWSGDVVTMVTTDPHGLSPGSIIIVIATGATGYDITTTVLEVSSPTSFTYALVLTTPPSGTVTGGTVSIVWPIPATTEPTYFEVITAPTPFTFQVAVNYSDGAWTSGVVTYAWNGTYYVTAVISPTLFQYQQYGPNASTGQVTGTPTPSVTPWGQAAPGIHQVQVAFLTRNDYITRPSPPVQFTANGGQYVSITNIPIGPPNIIARILLFTGAGGAAFFYIPVPAQAGEQIVSTSTVLNDNTSSTAFLDFSDPTLFSSIGTSIPGNDLQNQQVIDGALGFGSYASRLVTWGQRNRIQNLQNMGFEGGSIANVPTIPTGWIYTGPNGILQAAHFGEVWQIIVSTNLTPYGRITQTAYQDPYGNPIATPNSAYRMRAWLSTTNPLITVLFSFSSASTGFNSSAVLGNNTGIPNFAEAAFSEPMPAVIPSDLLFTVYAECPLGAPGSMIIDDLSVIYATTPYTDNRFQGSYVDNPEAFDLLTGQFGPSDDSRQIMDFAVIRKQMRVLTQDPGGRLHEVSDNGVTEPAGWSFDEVAANCGLLSAFALTKSQADDSSASGGEEWMAWASSSGARIFSGGNPDKISQEISPDWANINTTVLTASGLPVSYAWALNDPVARVMYFGLPTGNTGAGPNKIYQVDYKELDTAYQISTAAPIHTSFSGRLIATDHTRKWSPWNMKMNGGSLMYRTTPGAIVPVFLGGNGLTPGMAAGLGNAYILSPTKLTDDDYGLIRPFYTTYFFVTPDEEQAFQLGGGRKLLVYLFAYVSGVGNITITPLVANLGNPWPVTITRPLVGDPNFDLECAGGSALGSRIALQFASNPVVGQTDNSFNLQRVTAVMRKALLSVRGSAT